MFPQNSFPKQSRFSTRQDEVASLSPSPSTYKLPSPNDARGVTPFMMKSPSGKILDILKESKKSMAAKIGPGLYEPNPEKFNVRKIPNIKIGTSKRDLTSFEKAMLTNPGPGSYTDAGFNKNPTKNYTFKKEKRKNILETTRPDRHMRETSPGPGNYNLTGGIGEVPKYAMPGNQRKTELDTMNKDIE